MTRATARAALATAAACALLGCGSGLADERLPECFGIQDCEAERICFLGNCVAPGYSITSVYAELTPPNDSSWLPQQYPSELDLFEGLQDLSLRSAVTLSGRVLPTTSAPDGDSLTGVLRAQAPGTIPGRDVVRQASVSVQAGFALQALPGIYTLSFTPDLAAVTRPPVDYPDIDIMESREQTLPYPAEEAIVTVRGRVLATAAVQTRIQGARVEGTAEDASGAVLRSTVALTDANGEFAISFPPGAELFTISVGPGTYTLVPHATFPGLTITQAPNWLDDLVLDVPGGSETLSAEVRDDLGTPVEGASVLFDGVVGEGRFSASGSTAADGSVASSLLPGDYTVTIAPPRELPYAITSSALSIPAVDDPVQLTVGRKVQLTGTVRSHDGAVVADARVVLTRRDSLVTREFSTRTASDGSYAVGVDPGTVDTPAMYELSVQTERTSGLPWYRELLLIEGADTQHDVTLYASAFAYGRVREPGGAPLANVIIAFYSSDLGAVQQPLLVGVAQTNEVGEFVLPVPIPSEP